jgi:hypothetical protein
MIPGEVITFVVRRQTAGGFPATGFTATGDWSIIQNGIAAAPSAVVFVATVGAWSYYSLTTTLTATAQPLQFIVEPSSGDDIVDGAGADLTSYDADTLASLFTSSSGVSAASGITVGTDFGRVIQGDAWHSGMLTVPTSTISRWGYSDLTGMTISAALKNAPTDSATVITAAIISAASRTVSASWDAFPAGLALAAGEFSKAFMLDIQLKHTASGRIITALRGQMTVEWQADVTA